jgi:hypothetical protein
MGVPGPLDVLESAPETGHRLHERLRAEEFRVDGWLIHGPLLIEIDRLLTGLADDPRTV